MRPNNFVILSDAKDPTPRSLATVCRRVAGLVSLGLLLAASCSTPPASPSETASSRVPAAVAPDPLQSLDYASSQQPVANLDHDIALAGNDPAKLAPIAQRLLGLLHSRATTFAARQAICQRLAEFPAALLTSGDATALFTAMLEDEIGLNLARLALESVPGDKIDALFLHALERATPVTRLALVQSAGNRRLATAVPSLAPLLRDADPRVTSAAIRALAQIATPAALDALRTAPDPAAPDVVEARLAIARALPAARAIAIYNDILSADGAPANLRAAALLGLLDAEPDAAPARFVAALSGNDRSVKPVVIEAIAAHPAKNLARVLASELSGFDPSTQAAVIAALGRRGDPAASHAVAAATRNTDPWVRAAAIAALGELPGTPETAAALAEVVAHGETADAKLARQSLARLDGPDVATAILAGANTGAPVLRAAYLGAIGDRSMAESTPVLLQTRGDPGATVRVAALAALADIAPPATEAAVLDWALTAPDATERLRGLRAAVSIALRNPDLGARAAPIVAAADKAAPAVAVLLIPALPRLGGQAAVDCAARLAASSDADISNAALLVLSRWPDAQGLDALIDTATNAPRAGIRANALAAATNYLERDRSIHSPTLTNDVAHLLAVAPEDGTRLRLVRLLNRCADDAALRLAREQAGNPTLAAAADDAALSIRSNLAGPPVVSVSSSPWAASNLVDGNTATRWSVAADSSQWFQLDFHSARPFSRVVLDETDRVDEFPVRFAAFVTDDPDHPGPPAASGTGQPGRTVIDLPAGTRGRYLIVRHVGERDGTAWTVAEILID